jgi:Flp pilus assembly protein TadD
MMYLIKAIDVGQRTPEAYSFLGLAYHRLGRDNYALEAINKALNINPYRGDALDLREFILNER